MERNYTGKPRKIVSDEAAETRLARLVLLNDDFNSFDYVMDSLVAVCDHSELQAEQCTLITHFKGRCDIRSGERQIMNELRHRLLSRGLKAMLE
ncbi:MAG: ATP-dependent Clp protease adaptor ClpS [Bacteroidales bacterium]|nr:ATP-dependent Clp protease adaptor ClpS [Bacteroidales bacterium]MBN2698331.1 ATP-dependent Clp protease adaptor ClpS [Bacteroidales bacterium]